MGSRAIWALAASALLAAGCLASDAAERGDPSQAGSSAPRIAYLAPGPLDDPSFAPAFASARISITVAAAPQEDPATIDWIELPSGDGVTLDDAVGTLLADYDAVMVAPGVGHREIETIAAVVDSMSIPAVSLSGGAPGDLYVMAPDRRSLLRAMVDAAGRGACAAWDEGGVGVGRLLARLVEREGDGAGGVGFRVVPGAEGEASVAIREAGCLAVVWSGAPAPAGVLRSALAGDGGAVIPLIGADALRDADFLDAAGSAADGTIIVSGARDVSTRLRLEVRRFIQDYQAEVGSPPQPYAVEGWDAARILLRVLRDGPLENVVWEGLGGSYVLGGEVEPPTFLYSLRGHRWFPVGA